MERNRIDRRVLDAMGRFSMLRPGDRVAVGVSGGKDSLCLLHAMMTYQRRAPFHYDLIAVTVEQGKFKAPIRALEPVIRRLVVEWVVREDRRTLKLVEDGVMHGCEVCSRYRRGVLYDPYTLFDPALIKEGPETSPVSLLAQA